MMDTALSSTLLEQLNLGNKGANGWKGVAFTADITALWEECHVRMTKEKIMARLKTWNKYFQEISAMLDTSGFGWDWDRHVVKVDSAEVWADYIRAHPSLRHYKDKVIVNWSDLAALCGSDRAPRVNSATSVESANQIHVEDIDDEDDFGNGSMGPRKKKAKKPSNLDKIAEDVTHIAFNLDGPAEVAPLVRPRQEMTRIEMMYAALAPMTDLSEADMISAIDMFVADEIKCECFLVMPEILRRAWLRVHLGD
ncbi:hypothetical protein KSP39_PZI023585 [Platanthera zijinensis]|uniref:Myb/SANT-like domain-containing protein n=1 Tax=Platanthera zijinensis TaxID=2320716 RepID=A0AAP0ATF6_9ASPA